MASWITQDVLASHLLSPECGTWRVFLLRSAWQKMQRWPLCLRSACSREDNTATAAEEGRLSGDTGATSNTRKVRTSW